MVGLEHNRVSRPPNWYVKRLTIHYNPLKFISEPEMSVLRGRADDWDDVVGRVEGTRPGEYVD